jgi:transposase-like protein
MIEHFSKWLELVPLQDHNSGVAYAFLDRLLNRFRAPIEILTNQAIEVHGEFQKLCEKTLIDHCTTS